MATVTQTTDTNGNQILDVDMQGAARATLATAGTYVDKNIVINMRDRNIYTYDATTQCLTVSYGADVLDSQGVGF